MDKKLTRDDFKSPITAAQINKFLPQVDCDDTEKVRTMILRESENLQAIRPKLSVSLADQEAAATVVNAYNDAEQDYGVIRAYGIVNWMLSRRTGFAAAVLLRAKHDGIKFDL
jgi:hypothetical protein